MSLKRVSSSTAVSNLHRMKIYLDTCVVRFSQSERRQWLKRTETVNLYGKQQEVEIVREHIDSPHDKLDNASRILEWSGNHSKFLD